MGGGTATGGGSAMGGGAGGGSADAGNGSINDLTAAATAGANFHLPLDAALSPDGKTAYFAAVDTTTSNAAVFTASATTPGSATALFTGDPLASPWGLDVSTDGTTLAIADSAAVDSTGLDHGLLFTMSASTGGTPAVITGSEGYQPRGCVVTRESNADVVYFSGHDKTDGMPGVFKIGIGGGTVTVVAKGAPFADPSGLAISSAGVVYVADTIATATGHAQLLKIAAGTASVVIADMAVGYPAGVALSQDESTVLVSALDPLIGTDIVIRYDVAGNTSTNYSMTISAYNESAGLKRARNVDTYIWADSRANGGGTVYVINKQH
jgi:sugar lactone lactonase YvrE